MNRTLFLPCAAFVGFLAACGGSGASGTTATSSPGPLLSATAAVATPQPAACTPVRTHAAGDSDQTLESGGMQRTYRLHVPVSYGGEAPVALVFIYHGFSLDGKFMESYTKFDVQADEAGFVAVFPDGAGSPRFWNDTDLTAGAVDDVGFTRDLLTRLQADLCIDPDRIFAAGYSNGGGMAERVACRLPDRIAAVGLVEATYQSCIGAAPLIAFHGTSDRLVPFDGGPDPSPGGGVFPPVRRSVSEWARDLGCDGLGTISRPANVIELTTYRRCTRGDGEVLLYTIVGGGHTWAGAPVDLPEKITGPTNHDINATAVMWAFFAAHPLAH